MKATSKFKCTMCGFETIFFSGAYDHVEDTLHDVEVVTEIEE